jgi:hypothetical protein
MVLLTLAESETNSLHKAGVVHSHWQRNQVPPISFLPSHHGKPMILLIKLQQSII